LFKHMNMKTIFTLTAALFTTLCLSAQITVNRADFGQIGDLLFYANDTTIDPTFSLGAAGANVTWNFSTSVAANFYDSASFEDPTNYQGAPEEANIAIVEQESPSFFNITDSSVRIIIPLELLGGSNPQILISNLPFSYGGPALVDSSVTKIQGTPEDFGYTGVPFDSMRVSFNIHSTSTVDSWGTITTPAETVDALRVKNETNIDVGIQGKLPIVGTWIDVPFDGLNQNQVIYGWYAKGKKYTVAEAELDTLGNVALFRYQVASVPAPTGIAKVNKTVASFLQPNPVSDVLRLTFNSKFEEKGTLLIFDITGKVLSSQEIMITKNENEVLLKTSDLNNGIYFTRIVSEHVNSTSKFVVKH
jgi:hypothetical protein